MTVREWAWFLGIPYGTARHKLRLGARLDTDRRLDDAELLIHAGIRPTGWPPRLAGQIHANKLR